MPDERMSGESAIEWRGLARALLLAPLAAPFALAVALVGIELVHAVVGRTSVPSIGAMLQLIVGVFAVGVPLAYAATLVVALPAAFLLRRGGVSSRVGRWVIGGVAGCLVSLGLAPSLRGDLFSIPFPWWAASLLGVVSAETCWRLFQTRRTAS
jgi:hypothetical protein